MRIVVKDIADFCLFSNIYVALGASALTISTYFLAGFSLQFAYPAFVFFSTLFLYNFQRVVLSKNYDSIKGSVRHQWILSNRNFIFLQLLLASIGLVICVFAIGMFLILYIAPFTLFSVFYFLPFVNLRKVPGLKAFMVSFIWAIITVSFPFILCQLKDNLISNLEVIKSSKHIYMFMDRFFLVMPLAIIFNVRDLKHDQEIGIKTIPALFGITITKIVSVLCLVAFSILVIIQFRNHLYSSQNTTALLFSGLLSAIFILFNSEKSSEYYYVFAIDGMMLLQGLLVIALQLFE